MKQAVVFVVKDLKEYTTLVLILHYTGTESSIKQPTPNYSRTCKLGCYLSQYLLQNLPPPYNGFLNQGNFYETYCFFSTTTTEWIKTVCHVQETLILFMLIIFTCA